MKSHEKRLEALEQRCAAELDERMLQIAAAELSIDPEELRADVKLLGAEAKTYPSPEAHFAAIAESLGMTVDDLEREAHQLETAALATATVNGAARVLRYRGEEPSWVDWS